MSYSATLVGDPDGFVIGDPDGNFVGMPEQDFVPAGTGPVPVYTDAELTAQFQELLPTGPVWPRDPASTQAQVIVALMETPLRLTARARNLISDAFPVAPVELLPEWESTLGLPDPCAGEDPTLQLRQQQVAARFVAQGGQSVDYFISVAAQLGYSISITQFTPYRFGNDFGLPMLGIAWAFAWQINMPNTATIHNFQFGGDAFGEQFATVGDAVLRCEMERLSPGHTVLLFSYPNNTPDDPQSAIWDSSAWNTGLFWS